VAAAHGKGPPRDVENEVEEARMHSSEPSGTAHRPVPRADRLKNARFRLHLTGRKAREELDTLEESVTTLDREVEARPPGGSIAPSTAGRAR
jgi:hypothetical protein